MNQQGTKQVNMREINRVKEQESQLPYHYMGVNIDRCMEGIMA
jgi:hypothetical protein